VLVRDRARELDVVHQGLDTWAGLGLVVVGMTHSGWGRADHGLCGARLARELLPGRHRAPSYGGSAWEPTPWRAVQRAAWDVLCDPDTVR